MTIFKKHVFVCTSGKTCSKQDAEEVLDQLRHELSANNLKKTMRINKAGCMDQCGEGPIVVVYPEGTWYAHVKPEDCKEIVEKDLIGNKPVKRLIYSQSK